MTAHYGPESFSEWGAVYRSNYIKKTPLSKNCHQLKSQWKGCRVDGIECQRQKPRKNQEWALYWATPSVLSFLHINKPHYTKLCVNHISIKKKETRLTDYLAPIKPLRHLGWSGWKGVSWYEPGTSMGGRPLQQVGVTCWPLNWDSRTWLIPTTLPLPPSTPTHYHKPKREHAVHQCSVQKDGEAATEAKPTSV